MKLDIFDIVKNRPNEYGSVPVCPHCGNHEFTYGTVCSTALGWSGKLNPNHVESECVCKQCNAKFTLEEKYDNWWIISSDRKVLSGMPCCFEKYIYQCAKCGGEVHRKYTGLDGVSSVSCLSYKYNGGLQIKQFRIFFTCNYCGHGGETEFDYYRYNHEKHMMQEALE